MCGRVACLRSISGSFISIKVGIKEGVSLQFHACNDGVISAQKYKICNSNCQTELEPDPPTSQEAISVCCLGVLLHQHRLCSTK